MTRHPHAEGRPEGPDDLTDLGSDLDDALERAERQRETDPRTGRAAAAQRMSQQSTWVDLQIRRAQDRGDFDDLAGAGRPIADLPGNDRGGRDDPDWWVRRLVEREQITGVLPPALQLRKDDAELDARLDAMTAEPEVRRELAEFNERIRRALLTNLGGPPVITARRDVEAEVAAWRERSRRLARDRAEQAERRAAREGEEQADRRARRTGWRRLLP